MLDEADDGIQALPGLEVGEHERALAAHFLRVALHHFERGADHGREVDLVDHQEVRLHDPGPAFTRDLVAGRDIDHIQRQIREFGADRGGEIVAAGDKIPRKGGPGITRSDLLVINKIDLAPMVGASLDVMATDATRMRGARPFIFSNLKTGQGLPEIIAFIEKQGLVG